ncbi:MAG: redoxin domain-containing protein [Phycisphaeraceae bacterium]|nr:redoxin domain-containing protein [Phycisphaeraceae bacterium]MCB9847720.1 redoxin domain-containing protein [Phycisphaeraceae bacterium]
MTANANLKTRETPIAAGDKAPDFTLPDQDRNDVSLKGLLAKGGDVVLSFFPLAFTGVCTSEMECFTSDISKFKNRNTTVVGISCDSWATLKAFTDASKIDIPLLADMHREVCKAYGLYWPDLNVSSRGTIVIGSDGVVKWVSAREPGNQIDNAEVLSHVG